MKPIIRTYTCVRPPGARSPTFVTLQASVGGWSRTWTTKVPYVWETSVLKPHQYTALVEILDRKFLRFLGAA